VTDGTWRDRDVVARGVRLRLREWGGEDAGAASSTRRTPLVVLHGFTGSIEAMARCAGDLACGRRVVAIDLVGHGRSESPGDPAAYAIGACVDQVVAALAALGIGRAHWLGYSMGGRVALSAAVAHPERVRSAILVGASPGIADPAARAARVGDDEALARRLLDGGLERFVDEWMAKPLFASQRHLGPEALAAARRQRLAGDPAGLAASLRGMGAGAMPPLHDRLARVRTPLLLVVGALDAKFRAVAADLEKRVPWARTVVLPEAGHAAHLESPEAFRAAAARFLDEIDDTEEET